MITTQALRDSRVEHPPLICILGPTASGKTSNAIQLAQSIDGEIVSVDSRQIYRQMSIGTAKPTKTERAMVRHHLIDCADVDQPFSAADFQRLADLAIQDIRQRGRSVLLVGGSGLYFRGLVDGLFRGPGADPEVREQLRREAEKHGNQRLQRRLEVVDAKTAAKVHPNDLVRVVRALEVYQLSGQPISAFQQTWQCPARYPFQAYAIEMDRQILYQRIEARVDQMIAQGWIDEVRTLLAGGYSRFASAMRRFGYKQLIDYLDQEIDLDFAVQQIKQQTRRYAKRQLTWFRREPRIKWVGRDQLLSGESIRLYSHSCKSGN